MSARLSGRKWITAREYADASGKSMWVVHFELRTGRLRGRNLNEGTAKRPRWQVAASDLPKREGGCT